MPTNFRPRVWSHRYGKNRDFIDLYLHTYVTCAGMRSRANFGRFRLPLQPRKTIRLRLRLRAKCTGSGGSGSRDANCEVVQICDGSSSGSVKKTYPGSASGSEHNFRAAPAPNKMCRLQLRIVAYVTWPVADNSYKIKMTNDKLKERKKNKNKKWQLIHIIRSSELF